MTANVATLPARSSTRIIEVAGAGLRFRVEPWRRWSFIDQRFAYLGRTVGQPVRFRSTAADELSCYSPEGEIRALVWELGADVDLILGAEWARLAPPPGRFSLLRFPVPAR